MERNLYLITFDEEKPFVSVSIPKEIEEATACDRETYRAVLGSDMYVDEEDNGEILSFYRNIPPIELQKEISLIFKNFFEMMEIMKEREDSFPLDTASPWKSIIFLPSGDSYEFLEESYWSFKRKISLVLSKI